jgi:hypothetical protein
MACNPVLLPLFALGVGKFIALHRRAADTGTLEYAERLGNVGAGGAFRDVALGAQG